MLDTVRSLRTFVTASLLAVAFHIDCPIPAAAETTNIERSVPYFTLRNRLEDDDKFFGNNRGTLSAGRCIMDRTSLEFLSSVAEIAPFRIPEEILDLETIEEMPSDKLLENLQAEAAGNPLVYIHGYYIDFEKGCRRATVFKENAGQEDQFLWFSWPSDGSFLNYARDEVNMYWSVPDLAEIIADLHNRFGSGNVNLAGHSLGGRGLALALYEIAGTQPELRFGEIVLLAPDIDFEVFVKLLPRIRPLARSLTIYTSANDAALFVSAELHGYARLGRDGNDTSLLKNVEVIDTSDLPIRSANGHLYHIYNKEVGDDLGQLLNEGKLAAERGNLLKVNDNQWKLQPVK
ncbi:MAG: alpha/beta hydrolase [Rhizobiaceae bacterium]